MKLEEEAAPQKVDKEKKKVVPKKRKHEQIVQEEDEPPKVEDRVSEPKRKRPRVEKIVKQDSAPKTEVVEEPVPVKEQEVKKDVAEQQPTGPKKMLKFDPSVLKKFKQN